MTIQKFFFAGEIKKRNENMNMLSAVALFSLPTDSGDRTQALQKVAPVPTDRPRIALLGA